MAALEGFELSVSGDDVIVGSGSVDGVAVAGATLAAIDVAANDTVELSLIYLDADNALQSVNSAAAATELPDVPAGGLGIGSATATDVATAVTMTLPSLDGRGSVPPVARDL